MASTQDELRQTVFEAKCVVGGWATNLRNKEKYGSNIVCCERNMLLLANWIEIAEFYNCQNFDENGNITADIECLTFAEITLLMAKMKAIMKCDC